MLSRTTEKIKFKVYVLWTQGTDMTSTSSDKIAYDKMSPREVALFMLKESMKLEKYPDDMEEAWEKLQKERSMIREKQK